MSGNAYAMKQSIRPAVSFVIPAYNEAKTIAPCLDSIIRQIASEHVAAEIIVVNNASTDATHAVAASFPGVHVVDEPKKGLVQARRAGFLASSGELIANIDADTRLTPGWLSTVLREFKDQRNLVALSGPFIYYDLSRFTRFLVSAFYKIGFIIYLINRFMLRNGSMLQGGNFIVRRDALERIGGYDPERFSFYGEDTDLARRLHAVGPVKFTFALPIYTTGRRLAHEGVLRTALRYSVNYFWTIFFKRPFTKQSTDIRPRN